LSKTGVIAPELSRIQVKADFLEIIFAPQPCFQCNEPLCMYACPADAIYIDEATEAIAIDEVLCIGCCECIEACGELYEPARLRFDEDRLVVLKCDLCGGQPRCVMFCPMGAVVYLEENDPGDWKD
jgi:Fe-S-cluster-containing dehydrogenase component